MIKSNTSILHLSCFAVLCVFASGCASGGVVITDGLNTACQSQEGVAISAADAGGAQAHDRMLEPTQLSEKIRSVVVVADPDGVTLEAFGSGDRNHPFTTKRASSQAGSTPTAEFPWRATGKLFMKFGNSTFVCTASVIGKELLVTAGHCVHNFGQQAAGCADSVTFEPARHEGSRPFGTWTAKQWWIPTSYFDGADVCSASAPGIVCENDLAVIVLEKLSGKSIAEVTGRYGFPKDNDDFGYPTFLSERAAQITQLGYPSKNFDGTDVCSAAAPGIVCENDLAVIVLEKLNGQSIVEVTGKYGFPKADDAFGYADFLGEKAAEITQMGYPLKNFDGDKMIRTDSLGYWDDPNNVIIGSNQTGGSSGGPWLQNFGTNTPEFRGTPPFDNKSNQVVATTSWGFTSGTAKVQGASRFSTNTTYTTKSNIESLVDSACAANADAC